MDLELSGKRALVTGASRGIGLATAKRLAAEGARVVLNAGHSREGLDVAVAQVEGALGCFADVSDPASVDEMFRTLKSELGGIDILINNAAVTRDSLVMMLKPDAWREVGGFDERYRTGGDDAVSSWRRTQARASESSSATTAWQASRVPVWCSRLTTPSRSVGVTRRCRSPNRPISRLCSRLLSR